MERIRSKIKTVAASVTDISEYVMAHTLGPFPCPLLMQEAPWLEDTAEASQHGAMAWVVCCVLNHSTVHSTFYGFTFTKYLAS